MIIGIPKETLFGETRVSLFPFEIKKLISENIQFEIENNAGANSFISNNDYEKVNAKIVENPYTNADIIIHINPLSTKEVEQLKEGSCLIKYQLYRDSREPRHYQRNKKFSPSLDLIHTMQS